MPTSANKRKKQLIAERKASKKALAKNMSSSSTSRHQRPKFAADPNPDVVDSQLPTPPTSTAVDLNVGLKNPNASISLIAKGAPGTGSMLGNEELLGTDGKDEIPNMATDTLFAGQNELEKAIEDVDKQLKKFEDPAAERARELEAAKLALKHKIQAKKDARLVPPPIAEGQQVVDHPDTNLEETVTPRTTGESFQQFLEVEFEGYPNPREVIPDNQVAVTFFTSQNFEKLKLLDFKTIRGCGPAAIKSSMGSVTLTPYDQLVLTVGGIYYSLLPDPGFDHETFEVLHSIYATTNNPDVELSGKYSGRCKKSVDEIYNQGLDVIVQKIGAVILKTEVVNKSHYLEAMDTSECTTILDEMRTQIPYVYSIYKMMFQCTHGGLICIEPIPELVSYDEGLDSYLSAICVGKSSLPPNFVKATSRNPRFKVVAPIAMSATNIKSDSGKNSKKDAQEVVYNTGGPRTNRKSGPTPQSTDNLTLMNQGLPSRYRIDRNTTEFRDSVDLDSALVEKVDIIQDTMVYFNNLLTTMNETLIAMNERMERQDQAITVLLTQANQADLAARMNLNQTLSQQASAEALALIGSSPKKTMPSLAQVNYLIERVQKLKLSTDDPSLKKDLVELLTNCGDTMGAKTVTNAALGLPPGRNRILERLKLYKAKVDQ